MMLILLLMFNPHMLKGGGKLPLRPCFLLPFRNRVKLRDTLWRLFLNMTGLQDGSVRTSLPLAS